MITKVEVKLKRMQNNQQTFLVLYTWAQSTGKSKFKQTEQ